MGSGAIFGCCFCRLDRAQFVEPSFYKLGKKRKRGQKTDRSNKAQGAVTASSAAAGTTDDVPCVARIRGVLDERKGFLFFCGSTKDIHISTRRIFADLLFRETVLWFSSTKHPTLDSLERGRWTMYALRPSHDVSKARMCPYDICHTNSNKIQRRGIYLFRTEIFLHTSSNTCSRKVKVQESGRTILHFWVSLAQIKTCV